MIQPPIKTSLAEIIEYPSLEEILNDNMKSILFCKFLEKNFNEDTLLCYDFYEAVRVYLNTELYSKDAKLRAELILQRFIKEDSLEKIQITQLTRNEIDLDFDRNDDNHPNVFLFEQAIEEVLIKLKVPYNQFCKNGLK